MRVTEHFTRAEMECRCGCGRMGFTAEAMGWLEAMRATFGYPMTISSGCRCTSYDALVHKQRNPSYPYEERNGPHTIVIDDNMTVDVRLFGSRARDFVHVALGFGCTGIGINQRGPYTERFIHIDRLPHAPDRPRPWIWTY